MKYQSELVKEMVDTRGHKFPSLHYQSECVDSWIEETNGSYPKLCDYEGEWLSYILTQSSIGEFPYVTLTDVTEATVNNVVPYEYKSAILKGQTLVNLLNNPNKVVDTTYECKLSYTIKEITVIITNNTVNKYPRLSVYNDNCEWKRNVDAAYANNNLHYIANDGEYVGAIVFTVNANTDNSYNYTSVDEFLEQGIMVLNGDYTNVDIPYFEGMQSVKLPVLTTSNEDGTKTNILTVNEDVTLRSNGSVCDELDLLTGKLTQRIDEDGEVLSQEVVKTVVLNVEDQDGNKLMRIRPIEGTMYISTSSNTLQPTFTGEIPVEAITQNLASFIGE